MHWQLHSDGMPALERVMECQCVKADPANGIISDGNRYAVGTVGNPTFPLKLFWRIITNSLETVRIVRELPPLRALA